MNKIIKKDGRIENYDFSKIKDAVSKSAIRVGVEFSDNEWNKLANAIDAGIDGQEDLTVAEIHTIVELALKEVDESVAESYRNYRNYKKDYAKMMSKVLESADDLNYHIDRSNANTSAALISTKRSLVYTAFNKELYKKVFLSANELAAIEDGYIYVHDLGARMDTYNCCLFDMGKVLQGGFEWEHIGYNEPKDVKTACNLISDITLNCAAQQYGGFTLPEIDSILAPYAEKSYNHYFQEYIDIIKEADTWEGIIGWEPSEQVLAKAHKYAWKHTERDIEQGFQAFEHTFNTVASSRGDYPFVTMTGGCEESMFGQLVWECALRVRRTGQGHPGKKRPAIFPKLVFLYTQKLHGENGDLRYLYEEGVKTSAVSMYPDWLSLDEPDESLITKADAPYFNPSIAATFKQYHKFGVSRWKLDSNGNVYENPEWVDSIVSPMGKCKLQLI